MSVQVTPAGVMMGFLLAEKTRQGLLICQATRVLAQELIVRPPQGVKVTVSRRTGGRATAVDEDGGRLFTVWDDGRFSFREDEESNTDPDLKKAMAILLNPIAERLAGTLLYDPAQAGVVEADILIFGAPKMMEVLVDGGPYRATALDYGFFVSDPKSGKDLLSGIRHGVGEGAEWAIHPDPSSLPPPQLILE